MERSGEIVRRTEKRRNRTGQNRTMRYRGCDTHCASLTSSLRCVVEHTGLLGSFVASAVFSDQAHAICIRRVYRLAKNR